MLRGSHNRPIVGSKRECSDALKFSMSEGATGGATTPIVENKSEYSSAFQFRFV